MMDAIARAVASSLCLHQPGYRNTREIMKVAADFVSATDEQNDPESGLQIVKPDPDAALRSGPVPKMLTASTVEGEFQIAARKIISWQKSGLKPSDIAILYRADTQGWVKRLALLLSEQTAVYLAARPEQELH
jgi:superfamily I DNA/RNA helicase